MFASKGRVDRGTVKIAESILYGAAILGACYVLSPLLPWLLLALWVANLARPVHARVRKWVRGSHRGAAVMVIALTLLVFAPITFVAVSLSRDAVELGKKLVSSEGGRAALASLVSDGNGEEVGSRQLLAMARQHGERAFGLVSAIITAATSIAIGLLIFLYGTYVSLVDGPRAYAWFERVVPLRREVLTRIRTAFDETGRGLFIGVGVTGFLQAAVATATYLVLGVPRALVLGLLTFIASIIPSFGTALVWIPVAAGLAITGRTGAAIALAVVGIAVIGTVDNLLRPVIAHRADANMPTFIVMVGMFGGLAAFGGWGILIGPLALRLGMEALRLARDVGPLTAPPVDSVPASGDATRLESQRPT